jgi:replicative DNA helicase
MQVDVTTRMGALQPATATGLPLLDRLLAGGLRAGTLFTVAGPPGAGKTAFALLVAYMAARARAATVFVSPVLDETEVMARLATRALHRDHPESRVSYGSLWTGQAWQDDAVHASVSAALDTVVKKVGQAFHLYRAEPFEPTSHLAQVAASLWAKHERVVLVVDGLEAFSASVGGDAARAAAANASVEGRLLQAAYELRRIAEGGCAIVATVSSRYGDLVTPAASLAAELRTIEGVAVPLNERLLVLGARPVELVVKKNSTGPTGIVPLRFIAGAATFEERAP